MAASRVPLRDYDYLPENTQEHFTLLQRWATNLCYKLDCNHPRVGLIDEHVDKAIQVARMQNSKASAHILDDSLFVHSFDKTAIVCRQPPYVGVTEWDRIQERVLEYLRSIRLMSDVYHEDGWARLRTRLDY